MAKYAPLNYQCSKCNKIQSNYVWDNEIQKKAFVCDCGNVLLDKDIKKEEIIKTVSIKTPTKNRF